MNKILKKLSAFFNLVVCFLTISSTFYVSSLSKHINDLKKEYFKACEKTKTHGFITNPPYLIPIVPWNPIVTWNEDKTKILVVSWMSKWAKDNFYQDFLGKEKKTDSNIAYASWVSVPNEIKKFIKSYKKSGSNLSLHDRLNEKFGLPPSEEQKYFVEMWVEPKNVFRPCLDGDIVDSTCLPDPEENFDEAISYLKYFNPISEEYAKWFKDRRDSCYIPKSNSQIFPWSRLGSTFDYDSGSKDNLGVSEFVVRPGSTITVHSITPTNDYA